MAQHAPGWQHDGGPDVEYKLSPAYRRIVLRWFEGRTVVTVALAALGSLGLPGGTFIAGAMGQLCTRYGRRVIAS